MLLKRQYTKHHHQGGYQLWFVLGVLVLIIFSLGAWQFVGFKALNLKAKTNNLNQNIPAYVSVNGSYLFSGTIVLSRGVESYANGNYAQPFSGMGSLGNYDARVGDLECPVTTNYDSYANEVNNLVFNCSPNWLPYVLKYYPIINLSSNHLYDEGVSGFNETVSRLNSAGFQTVGNYNPHIQPDDCTSVVLPVHAVMSSGQSVGAFLPVAFCSYNYKYLFSPAPGEIDSIAKWSRIMPVIALLNEGPEYSHTASSETVAIAHQMVDEGASLVVGNGTHWVQNTEVYKGKLIAYSLGNFIFDQLDYDGRIALNLKMNLNLKYSTNVANWLYIGRLCHRNTTQCLSLAQARHLSKLYPSFSYAPIGSYGGYLQIATRATAQQQADIEKIANWSTTAQQLAQQP